MRILKFKRNGIQKTKIILVDSFFVYEKYKILIFKTYVNSELKFIKYLSY